LDRRTNKKREKVHREKPGVSELLIKTNRVIREDGLFRYIKQKKKTVWSIKGSKSDRIRELRFSWEAIQKVSYERSCWTSKKRGACAGGKRA